MKKTFPRALTKLTLITRLKIMRKKVKYFLSFTITFAILFLFKKQMTRKYNGHTVYQMVSSICNENLSNHNLKNKVNFKTHLLNVF